MLDCRLGRHDEAALALDELCNEARIHADERLLAWVLVERARARSLLRDRGCCAELLQEAALLARRLGLARLETMALTNLGMLHGQDGEPVPYAHYTCEALAVARAAGDDEGVAHCLSNLGGALSAGGQLDEALRCYDECLPLARNGGWPYIEALCLAGRGGLRFERGDPDGGLADYDASERILDQLGKRSQVVHQHLLQCAYLVRAGRADAAMQRALGCIELARQHGFQTMEATGQERLAEALEALGRFPDALRALRKSLEIQRGALDSRLAEAERAAARSQKALAAHRRAQWERERRVESEERSRALAAALIEREHLRKDLIRASRTDALTQLANRRAFDEGMGWTLAQSKRRYRPVALILCDLDHFKAINDSFGHAAGDRVLARVAARLAGRVRAGDLVARWGGEEFAVLLPDTELGGALALAEALRQAIADAPLTTAAGPLNISLSLGVAVTRPDMLDADALLRSADLALYEAKARGRNRVVAARGEGQGAARGRGHIDRDSRSGA